MRVTPAARGGYRETRSTRRPVDFGGRPARQAGGARPNQTKTRTASVSGGSRFRLTSVARVASRRRQNRLSVARSAAPRPSVSSVPQRLKSSARGGCEGSRSAPLSGSNRCSMTPRARWAIAILALFAFRLFFGLFHSFFGEDETQIFLIGFRYFATGAWPYFGPDVVWTKSEIPGALQGLLVGVPLRLWPVPEAPYVLVNLLSFAALAALCVYIARRLPSIPRWLIWGWLMTLPWTLQFSTHILNPDYVLAPAIVFFIGFFEAVPALRIGIVSVPAAFALMGGAVDRK